MKVNINKLKEIIAKGDKARTTLYNIESKEEENRNKNLVGKFFKFKNSFSCPKTDEDYWWLYIKIVKVDGSYLKCIQFQKDIYNKIKIVYNKTIPYCANMFKIEISEEEGLNAWQEIHNGVNKFLGEN